MQPEMARIIFERTQEAEAGFLNSPNPTVLSCGGIYLPRGKLSERLVYQVLNLANQKEPIKIYVGRHRNQNLLHEVLAKESLN